MPPLLALLPLCVQNGEPGLAFAVLEALDALVTDNPGVEDGLKNHIADGFTDMSVVLAGAGRFAANFRGRWLGADRRLRLPPGFADSHREGYQYVLPGAARAVHTNDGKRLAQRPRHTPQLAGLVLSSYLPTTVLLG